MADTPGGPALGKLQRQSLFRRFLVEVWSFLGWAFGAGGAAATGDLIDLRNASLRRKQVQRLTPAEVAAAIVKNTDHQLDWEEEAAENGVPPDRLAVIVDATGNPPGPETLLDMLNRGFIDVAEVKRGMRQGYLKDEWSEAYTALRYRLLPPEQVVQALVQGHVEDATARDLWANAGMLPGLFDIAYETAGNPPGIVEMLHLWNRGVVTEAQVDQAIKESRVKDKYIAPLKALAVYLPPPRTITTLLSHGAIDQATAKRLFQDAGLSPTLADAYVQSALHTKTASHKELSVSEVRTLYADGVLDRATALHDLSLVGYAETEANLLLDLATAQQKRKLRDASVTRVRTVFLQRKIDRATAEGDLAKLGLDSEAIANNLTMWEVLQTTPTRTLSVGELNSAYKKGLITHDDFVARATGLGYSPDDAEILAEIDVPPTTTTGA